MATESSTLSTEGAQVERKQDIGATATESVNGIRDGHYITDHSPVNEVDKEASDSVNSEVDAEGEDVDDEYTETYAGDVVPVATPISEVAQDTKPSVAPSLSEGDASSVEEEEDTSNTGSSSDAEGQWAAESDAADEAELETSEGARCVFCDQDEDHDPNVDFEECLDCIVCGNIAHRQCARDAGLFDEETDSDRWRCNDCVANGLEEEPKLMTSQKTRRRSSAPKLTRDLLPAHRGSVKPDSHSVFNTLILDDDPMDGSRSLRKRKQSGEDMEDTPGPEAKKQRCSIDSSEGHDDAKGSDKSEAKENESFRSTFPTEESIVDSTALHVSPEQPRSSRRQRMRKQDKALVTIRRSGRYSMMASFRLNVSKLQKIIKPGPRRRKRIVQERPKDYEMTPEEPSHYPALQMSSFINPLFTSHDRATDDVKSKPYGGILSELEADTSKTFPLAIDRSKFESARQKAEEDWKQKVATVNTYSDPVRIVQKVAGPPSKIRCINFGGYEIDTWHAAPYPEEYSRNKVLYICEFCLKYMSSDYVAWRHNLKCAAKHPPGDEIYKDGKFSFFEVDGRKNPVYCQNLCLLAKLFLGSKTLYYDVEPFLFYIMTENDEYGCHFVGYFSKEKRPSSLNNVSCILVLPIHQRRGFGHFLIDFSYRLTRVEKKAGSPEKPLSDMGLVSYRSYWRLVLCYELLKQKSPLSITDLSDRTGMTADDIVSALEALRALVRDPETGTYALRVDYDYLKQYIESYERKGYCKINSDALVWTPYVMGHNDLVHYEEGPSLQTVAPREDDQQNVKDAEEGVQMEEHIAKLGRRAETMVSEEFGLGGEEECQLQQQLHQEAQPATQTLDYSLQAVSDSTQPSTPMMNGIQEAAVLNGSDTTDSIPPTRFQVWPPIHKRIISTITRRRAGRPFGSRRRTFTPARRRTNRASYASPKSAVRSSMARRPKSKLGETNGLDDHSHEIVGDIAQIKGSDVKSIIPGTDRESTGMNNANTDEQTMNGVAASTEATVSAAADTPLTQNSLAVNGTQTEDTLMENG